MHKIGTMASTTIPVEDDIQHHISFFKTTAAHLMQRSNISNETQTVRKHPMSNLLANAYLCKAMVQFETYFKTNQYLVKYQINVS